MQEDLRYLQQAHADGVLVPVVGAGLSAAAAGLPAWPELLNIGLKYAIANCGLPEHAPLLDEARKERIEGRLITAFDKLQEALGVTTGKDESLNYRAFLADVFAEPTIYSTDLLDALRFLQPRRIITTNYDLLLERDAVCPPLSLTWQQPAEIRQMFRVGRGIVHLHGSWDRPSSVVLSQKDYNRIKQNKPAKAIAEAIFHSGVLMFLATSLNGTHDPHLGDLLAEFESLADPARGEPAPHVMLLRGRLDGQQLARLQMQGIRAVSYGDNYDDLPGFLRLIADTGQVQITTRRVDDLLTSVGGAASLDDALREVGKWIAVEAFPGREVRIAFSEKRSVPGGGHMLRQRAVVPLNSSGNLHNYPLSIAAWALLEGRIIAWPAERGRTVNFALLDRLRKLDRIEQSLASHEIDESPEVARYVDLKSVRAKFANRTLLLQDFYQDWASDQPRTPYIQFLSVPVPMIEQVSNRADLPEYGVFNIDGREQSPLLDRRINELLRLASAVTVLVFKLFIDQSDPVETRPSTLEHSADTPAGKFAKDLPLPTKDPLSRFKLKRRRE